MDDITIACPACRVILRIRQVVMGRYLLCTAPTPEGPKCGKGATTIDGDEGRCDEHAPGVGKS